MLNDFELLTGYLSFADFRAARDRFLATLVVGVNPDDHDAAIRTEETTIPRSPTGTGVSRLIAQVSADDVVRKHTAVMAQTKDVIALRRTRDVSERLGRKGVRNPSLLWSSGRGASFGVSASHGPVGVGAAAATSGFAPPRARGYATTWVAATR